MSSVPTRASVVIDSSGMCRDAEAEVGGRIQRASVGEQAGGRQQPATGGVTITRGPGHLLGDVGHQFSRFEVRLGVGAVPGLGIAERHQQSRRVEHVGDRRIGGVQVTDRVGEHDRHLLVAGEAGDERRGAAPIAVMHGLQHEIAGMDGCAPSMQVGAGEVGPAPAERPTDLGTRAEQDEQLAGRACGDVLGEQLEGGDRPTAPGLELRSALRSALSSALRSALRSADRRGPDPVGAGCDMRDIRRGELPLRLRE